MIRFFVLFLTIFASQETKKRWYTITKEKLFEHLTAIKSELEDIKVKMQQDETLFFQKGVEHLGSFCNDDELVEIIKTLDDFLRNPVDDQIGQLENMLESLPNQIINLQTWFNMDKFEIQSCMFATETDDAVEYFSKHIVPAVNLESIQNLTEELKKIVELEEKKTQIESGVLQKEQLSEEEKVLLKRYETCDSEFFARCNSLERGLTAQMNIFSEIALVLCFDYFEAFLEMNLLTFEREQIRSAIFIRSLLCFIEDASSSENQSSKTTKESKTDKKTAKETDRKEIEELKQSLEKCKTENKKWKKRV